MNVRLVLVVGDPGDNRACDAYVRPAAVDVPARRGDIFYCPVGNGYAAVVSVVDSRVGGGDAVLVVLADTPVGSAVANQAAADPMWVRAPVACGLQGDVVGVFLDEGYDDWVHVDQWPQGNASQLQALVELGFVDRFSPITVPGLEADAAKTGRLGTASVVPFPTHRRQQASGQR